MDIVLALGEGNYGQGQIDPEPAPPKNVILIIGDGMGPAQVEAASMFLGEDLYFEGFPFQTEMVTSNADFEENMVDSAAGGTAIATGVKVNYHVVSQQIPGDESDLKTLLEVFKDAGKSTGLVTTDSVAAATPATFGAHEPTRENFQQIVDDYFTGSRPNVLFGADPQHYAENAAGAGYTVVSDVSSMNEVASQEHSAESHVFGGFLDYNNLGFWDNWGEEYDANSMAWEVDEVLAELQGKPRPFADLGTPYLSQMTEAALDIIGQNEDGFFLMVEQAFIDHACHTMDINNVMLPSSVKNSVNGIASLDSATIELAKAVQTAVEWVESQDLLGETLILVTADHETGGLVIDQDNGPGQHPKVSLTAESDSIGGFKYYYHTRTNVPVYAIGRNAALFGAESDYGKEVLDNTEIFARATQSQSAFTGQAVVGPDGPQ
jgi:alkaline phosphatase